MLLTRRSRRLVRHRRYTRVLCADGRAIASVFDPPSLFHEYLLVLCVCVLIRFSIIILSFFLSFFAKQVPA